MAGTVLVVDDVATNRIILKVKLSTACYEVLQASGGQEALALARAERPDLILLDVSMPDLDGYEVCRRLKADPRTAEIPVVMVTAHGDAAARIAALEAGAEDFLTKPLDDAILLARLRSLLRARSTVAELALRETTSAALGLPAPDLPSRLPVGAAPLALPGPAGPLPGKALPAASAGFAEPAGAAWDAPAPGRIAILAGDPRRATAWQTALSARLGLRVDVSVPTRVLRDDHPDGPPDVLLIAETMLRPGDGLALIPELRARPATRHSAIVMAVEPEARLRAAMALDLGASDIVTLPFAAEETALRLGTQLARKRQADLLRSQLRDGLRMAVTDPLTGLYNRRYALSHLDRIHARAMERGRSYAVMLADLDRFKQVNDRHGHAAGDRVLQTVAERLRGRLRAADLIARIGGEEFLIVMPDIGAEAAQRAAERLCQAVEAEPVPLDGGASVLQTVSIGLALGGVIPGDEPAADGVSGAMDRADRALYRAKSEGRNRARLALPSRSAA